MAEIEIAGLSPEGAAKSKAVLKAFAERYRSDASFRASVDEDAAGALRALGLPIPSEMSVRVAADTEEVRHVVLPPDPNMELGDEALAAVAGGDSDTIASASTLGCSTLPSSISTVGSGSI